MVFPLTLQTVPRSNRSSKLLFLTVSPPLLPTLNRELNSCTGEAFMAAIHSFNFPAKTKQAALECPTDFDLHVSVGDIVAFEALPGQYWKITLKIYKVLLNNTVEYVDYKTVEVENPYP
jgi:hypothetical protein